MMKPLPPVFYAFDILVSNGEDLRRLPPLSMRKASLARLLARRVDGIFLSDFEQGEIGPDPFRHACLLGLSNAGLARAREKGVTLGRPRIAPDVEKRIQRLRSKGHGILKIARELGVGTSAVQRVLAAG
jgi:hypothetical protein